MYEPLEARATAAPDFPGAAPPERSRDVASMGIRLRVHEWGDPSAPPLVLCHGMFDHARSFDVLAPLLATRFRVVAWDARGHGDSEHADAYAWNSDIVDLTHVLRSLGRPVQLVGHSRGGGLATDTAAQCPELVRQLVNIDGFGPPPEGFARPGSGPAPDGVVPRFRSFLDRRRTAGDADWRPYASLDDLVERRLRENPRLSRGWLRYFCFHGARRVTGGWVWKVDPLAPQGFGPWRPEWIGPRWGRLRVPLLAVTGSEADTWGPLPDALIAERLAHVPQAERAVVRGAGHFVHIEQPRATAELLLGALAR